MKVSTQTILPRFSRVAFEPFRSRMEVREVVEPLSSGPVALRALFVDDSAEDVELMLRELSRAHFLTTHVRVERPQDFKKAVAQGAWDIILCDYSMQSLPVEAVLSDAANHPDKVPVVVVSGYAGEEVAVNVMHMGACDYVCKDNLRRLSSIIHRELSQTQARLASEKEHLRYRDRLRQASKLEALGQLAAGVAHEINTPMQFISDNLSFMKKALAMLEPALVGYCEHAAAATRRSQYDPATTVRLLRELPEAIDAALEGTQRVARIIDAMKGFSHPGSGTPRRTDLVELVHRAAVLSRAQWKLVADLDVVPREPLPQVLCYADELGQAVINMLVNAAHAIEDAALGKPGRIAIHLQASPGGVEVKVSDNGLGMSEEVRARMFEPFFTTKPEGRGTGQGLTQVYATVVKQHGGDINVESTYGSGTTIALFIPLAPPNVVQSPVPIDGSC